ncbi:unnamed protein product, partial [Effrenium voratum]
MAPSELAWQAEDEGGFRSTAPWLASGAEGLELRLRVPPSGVQLRELPPGAAPRTVAAVNFDPDSCRRVGELLPSSRWQHHVLPGGGVVRLCWEKAAGRWKLWVEAGGERLVLQEATFNTPEPQLELRAHSRYVDHFDVCLLPLPGPGLQSPPPACAQLQARIDQLTAELEESKQQKAEIQQEKQNLQQQLDGLTVEKAEEMKKVEALQRENEALQQIVLTPEVQKSGERILKLKEDCDDVLA